MLTIKDINKIEQIICYHFNNQELLNKLFNKNLLFKHDEYQNGLNIFESFIKAKVGKITNGNLPINYHYKYEDIKEMFEDDSAQTFYSSLKKIGLNEYLHFNESTDPYQIYDFIFLLINAIDVDSNHNNQQLMNSLNKITLFDYLISYPTFEYDKLNLQFVFDSYQCKHAHMQIHCPKFQTYFHQDALDTFDYLAYYFIDLFNKTADENDQLKSIWNNVKLNENLLVQLDNITKQNNLYYGFLWLHDEYYWYCLVFVSKFNLAFFAKSEFKEDAKLLAIKSFINYYANQDDDEKYLIEDGKAVSLDYLFFNLLAINLDLHHYDKNKLLTFDWNQVNEHNLINELNKNQIFSLSIMQKDHGKYTCVIFANNSVDAFGFVANSYQLALLNACKLLINYYQHQKYFLDKLVKD